MSEVITCLPHKFTPNQLVLWHSTVFSDVQDEQWKLGEFLELRAIKGPKGIHLSASESGNIIQVLDGEQYGYHKYMTKYCIPHDGNEHLRGTKVELGDETGMVPKLYGRTPVLGDHDYWERDDVVVDLSSNRLFAILSVTVGGVIVSNLMPCFEPGYHAEVPAGQLVRFYHTDGTNGGPLRVLYHSGSYFSKDTGRIVELPPVYRPDRYYSRPDLEHFK